MGYDPRSHFWPARAPNSLALPALVSAYVGVGCSLLVDADRQQCAADADCRARGFGDAICVEALCRGAPLPLVDEAGALPEEPSEVVPPTSNVPPASNEGVVALPVADVVPDPDPIDAEVPTQDAGGDPEWACLENFTSPSVAAGSLVSYRLRFERGREANVPPAGLTVRLCRNDDATCAAPIGDIPEPDATGLLTLALDPTFRGYLEVEAAEHVPSLAFLPPLVSSTPEPQIIRLIQEFDFSVLLRTTNIPLDDGRGFAILLTNSCLDQRAAGVVLASLDTDEQTVAYYYRAGQPDPDALETDAQGAGGWSQLPVGTVVAEARRADTLDFIGVAEFQSRAGFISYVPIGPTSPP